MSNNWLQHALRRTGWRPQRQVIALATLGMVLALLLGALYLSQVAAEANMGRALSVLIAQRNKLERTNEQLRAEIAGLRSVPRLLARAQELGFFSATAANIEYLVIEGYNPNRENADTVAPLPADTAPQPVYDETFGGWLQQQWDSLRQQFSRFGQREGG